MMTKKLSEILTNVRSPLLVGPLASTVPAGPYDFHVFIDGGTALRMGSQVPSVSVGDGDSHDHPQEIDFLIPKEKDLSDLAFALLHLPPELDSLSLVGFVGGRLDHQLAVLGELAEFISRSKLPKIEMAKDGVFVLNRGHHELELTGSFSLISPQIQKLGIRGSAKYLLEVSDDIGALSSKGLSNVGFGNVKICCEKPIVLLLNPEVPADCRSRSLNTETRGSSGSEEGS